jgi:hypothetical protein
MGPLRERLAIDQRQALECFVVRLHDTSDATVDRGELLYNAGLLAHYAQVSTQPGADVPTPANLSAIFDQVVVDTTLQHDSLMMETAGGGQCLLLAGFFEDQMRRRHNVRGMPSSARAFSAGRRATSRRPRKPGCSTPSRGASNRGASATRKLRRELRDQPVPRTPPTLPAPGREIGKGVRPIHRVMSVHWE